MGLKGRQIRATARRQKQSNHAASNLTIRLLCLYAAALFLCQIATAQEISFSQVWARQLGTANDDKASGVAAAPDGSIYVCGTESGWIGVIAMYEPGGNLLWTRQYADGEESEFDSVAVDANGNVYVSGGSCYVQGLHYPTYYYYNSLLKYSAAGDVLWIKTFSSGVSKSVVSLDGNGNAYLLGTNYLKKYDPNGNVLWSRSYAGSAVAADSAGNTYIGSGSGIRKVDGDGNQIWLGGYSGEQINSLAVDESGNVYVGGETTSVKTPVRMKLDSAGNVLWDTSDTFVYGSITSVALDQSGNVVFGGTSGPDASSDVLLQICDPDGDELWTDQFGTAQPEGDTAVAMDSLGCLYVSGSTKGVLAPPGDANQDIFLVKYAPSPAGLSAYGGANQAIIQPVQTLTLTGAASDDAEDPLPQTYHWSMDSGPGTVQFTDANALVTAATFSTYGQYLLRLTVTTSEQIAWSACVVTYSERSNAAPIVNAGPDQTVHGNQATLVGSVSDDGYPNPPGVTTYTWSMVSGMLGVAFANANALTTTVTFPGANTYVLRLTANDSRQSVSDDCQVVVGGYPRLNAGSYATLSWPEVGLLSGGLSDDLPVTVVWSKTSGPGTVSFGSPTSVTTTVSFSCPGIYVLRLTATDAQNTNFSECQVVAKTRPVANAGPAKTCVFPGVLTLNGTASDDGVGGGITNTTWTVFSGPGTVTFGNANALSTTATFSAIGTYELGLTVTDWWTSTITGCTVNAVDANSDSAPTIDPGADRNIVLPINSVALSASVSDDGLPTIPGYSTVNWNLVSGPPSGTVIFADGNSANTTATFSAPGSYVLKAVAFDGLLYSADNRNTITITVAADANENLPPLITMPPDMVVTLPAADYVPGVSLMASVSDEGPNPVAVRWSGSGGYFTRPDVANGFVCFSRVGTYVLQLDANDGVLHTARTMTVTVLEDNRSDFDNNGVVDGLDFLAWQRSYNHGTASSGAPKLDANFADANYAKANGDANGDGKVDGSDFLIWQQDYTYCH